MSNVRRETDEHAGNGPSRNNRWVRDAHMSSGNAGDGEARVTNLSRRREPSVLSRRPNRDPNLTLATDALIPRNERSSSTKVWDAISWLSHEAPGKDSRIHLSFYTLLSQSRGDSRRRLVRSFRHLRPLLHGSGTVPGGGCFGAAAGTALQPQSKIPRSHPAMIRFKSFMMSNKWYGSLGLASKVKCS